MDRVGCIKSVKQESKLPNKKGIINLQFDEERLICSYVDARIQEFDMNWILYHRPNSSSQFQEAEGDEESPCLYAGTEGCRTLEGHKQEVWGLQFDATKIVSG